MVHKIYFQLQDMKLKMIWKLLPKWELTLFNFTEKIEILNANIFIFGWII